MINLEGVLFVFSQKTKHKLVYSKFFRKKKKFKPSKTLKEE